MSTSDKDKIRILLPHWLEHNANHQTEFAKWEAVARNEGLEAVADLIGQAMAKMEEMDGLLQRALNEAGGPVAGEGHHHHH
jgi:hypothetical protein